MAPEQVEGRIDQIGPATDVYALGVILYQLLSRKLPFEGSVGGVLAGIVHRQPPPPDEVCATRINPRLEMACLRAIAKRIDQRYRSARSLADELKHFLEGGLPQTASAPITGASPDETPPERQQDLPQVRWR